MERSVTGANALGNYFYETAFLSNVGFGFKEESSANLNIARDCSFAGNGSGPYELVGSVSKVENAGDIATEAAKQVWETDITDGTFAAGKIGYWFYKLKQALLNRRDAGVTTPGVETVYQDDDVTPSMTGDMKKASGAAWNPTTEGVAERERMS